MVLVNVLVQQQISDKITKLLTVSANLDSYIIHITAHRQTLYKNFHFVSTLRLKAHGRAKLRTIFHFGKQAHPSSKSPAHDLCYNSLRHRLV